MRSGKLKVVRGRVKSPSTARKALHAPSAWLTELKNIPADPDFMKKRLQPKTPKRAIFE